MQEMWKDVLGYEELFQVSNIGRFYSKRSNKVLKLNLRKDGYLQLSTSIGGRMGVKKCFKIHILVAELFLDKPTQEQLNWAEKSHYGVVFVNHIDGDKTNNKSTNLEWATGKENTQHYLNELDGKIKLSTRRQTQAKMSDSSVRYAREKYKEGISQRAIAKILGVSRDSVGRAIRGYKWVC